jgi:ANTAR domain
LSARATGDFQIMRATAHTSVDVPAAPGEELEALRAEVAGLRRALESRGLIERAKGVLMYRHGWTADQAFEHLAGLSQHTNTRLAALAGQVVDEAATSRDVDPRDEAWAYRLLDLLASPVMLLRPLPGHDSPVADFRVEYANPASLMSVGSNAGQLVGRRLTKIYPPAMSADMVAACRAALLSGGSMPARPNESEAPASGLPASGPPTSGLPASGPPAPAAGIPAPRPVPRPGPRTVLPDVIPRRRPERWRAMPVLDRVLLTW